MSTQIPPEAAQQIGTCLFAGRKIEAIKLYRTHTGSDLLTAKNAVETLEAELRAREPARFVAAPAKAGPGCLLAVAVLVVGVALLAALLIRHT